MKHLYIVRHGETVYNKTHKIQGRGIDASLNDLGIEQGKDIANALKDLPITKIVTSSLKRTKESALPLSIAKNLPIESYADIDEMNFGDLEGKNILDIKNSLLDLHRNWSAGKIDFKPKNGESPEEVFKRANDCLQNIFTQSDNSHIAVFIHGRLIRILLSEWIGGGLVQMQKIKHTNGGINYLTFDEGLFTPVYLNNTSHLTHFGEHIELKL